MKYIPKVLALEPEALDATVESHEYKPAFLDNLALWSRRIVHGLRAYGLHSISSNLVVFTRGQLSRYSLRYTTPVVQFLIARQREDKPRKRAKWKTH